MKPLLLVEDNDHFARLICRVLAKTGRQIVWARDGEQAQAQFVPGRFGLLLADVNLGGSVNGIELARAFRDDDPGLRVFIMSGHLDELKRARAAGFPNCFFKPRDFVALARTLTIAG